MGAPQGLAALSSPQKDLLLILRLLRFASGKESTLGALSKMDRPGGELEFLCFTMEDQYQTSKVYAETRIPNGQYPITLRQHGGFHERYRERYGHMHIGMLEILNVPGFTDVLIHCGNTDDDSAGCLLVGDTAEQNVTDDGRIGGSRSAYERIYPILAEAVAREGAGLTLQIWDYA